MTTAPFEGSTVKFSVGLTGFEGSQASTEAAYKASLDWFAHWGDTPTKGLLSGKSRRVGISGFKSVARTVTKSGLAGIDYGQLWHEDELTDRPQAHCHFITSAPVASASFAVSSLAQPIVLESLVAPLQTVIAALGVEFGEIWLTADIELEVPGLGQTVSHIHERWKMLANDVHLPGWRHGWLGTVNTWNLLTPAHLGAKVAGTPMRQWIEADATRGQLRQLSDKIWLWSVEPTHRAALFKALWDARVIFDSERWFAGIVWREVPDAVLAKVVDGQTMHQRIEAKPENGRLEPLPGGRHRWGVARGDAWNYRQIRSDFKLEEAADGSLVDKLPPKPKKPSKAKQAALAKRNALVAKVQAQLEQGHANGLVGLDEFFDGNFDTFSLATNFAEDGRPSLKRCHQIFADLAARDDVRTILFEITETPEADEPDDDDIWLICNDVLVITSAPLADVQRVVAKLAANVVGEPGDEVTTRIAAQAGLTLTPGERIVSLWWD